MSEQQEKPRLSLTEEEMMAALEVAQQVGEKKARTAIYDGVQATLVRLQERRKAVPSAETKFLLDERITTLRIVLTIADPARALAESAQELPGQ